MLAPRIRYLLSKPISMYFPKRLLLSFRVVLAFPMDCLWGAGKGGERERAEIPERDEDW